MNDFKTTRLKIFGSVFLFCISIMTSPLLGQSIRAGVAKVNITPSNAQQLLGYGARKSTGVHDSIFHRIVVMDDGEKEYYLVSSDICVISPAEYDRVAEILVEKWGIDKKQFWWSLTHTHSAPEVGPPGLPEVFMGERYTHQYDQVYTDFVVEQLINGIAQAKQAMTAVHLGVGWGHSQANINRRARTIDGHTRLGMNPDGPVDRKIGIIKLWETTPDRPKVIIANYAIHGTVLGGQCLEISGDAPGMAASQVEEETGSIMLFINGAAGNIAPIYSVYPSPAAGHLIEFKKILGQKIVDAQKRITFSETDIRFEFGELIFRSPRKENLGWTEHLKAYSSDRGNGEAEVLVPIQFLKLNSDIAIWAAPLELFCEISNEIRSKSPFPYTFYYGYTNGWLGYMLTESEYHMGGYEVSVSPYRAEAGAQLREAVSAYLAGELSK